MQFARLAYKTRLLLFQTVESNGGPFFKVVLRFFGNITVLGRPANAKGSSTIEYYPCIVVHGRSAYARGGQDNSISGAATCDLGTVTKN